MHARSSRFVLVLSLLLAPSARANPFDLFGAGARGQAMAGAMTATADDHTATWHNPALLPRARPSVALGLFTRWDRTSIRLSPRPAGYDPPRYDTRRSERQDTDGLPALHGVQGGGTASFLVDDLHVGFAAFLPFSGIGTFSTAHQDELEQYFSNRLRFDLIGERVRSEVFATAIAYRLSSWFSFGVGLSFMPTARTITRVYTPNPAQPGEVVINTELEQTVGNALVLGAASEPLKWLRLGLAFRDELHFELAGKNVVQIRGQEDTEGHPYNQRLNLIAHQTPPTLSFAAAVELVGLTGTVEGAWRRWGRYLDDHGQPAGLHDTVDVTAAAEFAATGDTFLRGGLGWHPTPVPDQTGRTNFVDNDRLVVGFGAGRRWSVGDNAVRLDVGVQLHALLQREVQKSTVSGGYPACSPEETRLCDEVANTTVGGAGLQTGNPGFPGYAHGGYFVTAAVDLRWEF